MSLDTPGLLVASASESSLRRTPNSRRTPPRKAPLHFSQAYRKHSRSQAGNGSSVTMAIASCLIACIVLVGIALMSGVIDAPAMRKEPASTEGARAFGTEMGTMEAVGDEYRLSGGLGAMQAGTGATLQEAGAAAAAPHTLVLYIFSNTDPQYYGNLVYFVKHGLPGCHACEYIIVINQDAGTAVRAAVPHACSTRTPTPCHRHTAVMLCGEEERGYVNGCSSRIRLHATSYTAAAPRTCIPSSGRTGTRRRCCPV